MSFSDYVNHVKEIVFSTSEDTLNKTFETYKKWYLNLDASNFRRGYLKNWQSRIIKIDKHKILMRFAVVVSASFKCIEMSLIPLFNSFIIVIWFLTVENKKNNTQIEYCKSRHKMRVQVTQYEGAPSAKRQWKGICDVVVRMWHLKTLKGSGQTPLLAGLNKSSNASPFL